jgi:hypothetical protein
VSALPCRQHSYMWRPLVAAGCALAIAVLTGGCGLVNASGQPSASSETPSIWMSSPQPSASASVTTSPSPSPADAVAVELAGSSDGRPASLRVSVTAPRSCEPASDTEYTPVSIVFADGSEPTKRTGVSSNLRLELSVTGGDGIAIGNDPASSCGNISALPSTTWLQTQNLADEHQTMTVYVVARTGPDAPDPYRGVTLELRNLRHHPDDIDSGAWTWDVEQATTANACPDDPNSVCVPIAWN